MKMFWSGLLFYLFLLSQYQPHAAINVTKCCPFDSILRTTQAVCSRGSRMNTDESVFLKYKPKIFSIQDEAFINDSFFVDSFTFPNCTEGEEYSPIYNIGHQEENFLLLSEGSELFISEEGLSLNRFCVDDLYTQNESGKGGDVVGTVALICKEKLDTVCLKSFCLNNCCPPGTVYVKQQEECVSEPEFELQPRYFHDNNSEVDLGREDIKIFYREPNCSFLHVIKEGDFHLGSDGLLHVGTLTFPRHHFCINPVKGFNSNTQQAKVCNFDGIDEDSLEAVFGSHVIPALMIISEVFLLLTFALHIIVPEFRKQIFGWMKMCTVACLFLSYQWFLIIIFGKPILMNTYPVLCQMLGFFIQFCFLASFAWMTTMSVEVWLTFRKLTAYNEPDGSQRSQHIRFKYYNLFSFGFPLLVTTVTLVIHLLPSAITQNIILPSIGYGSCFIDGYLAKVLYFHGIIAILLLVNMLLFVLSAYSLLFGIWAAPLREEDGRGINVRMLWIVFELFLVMGLTWGSEVLTISLDWIHGTSHYLGGGAIFFDIVNALQGFFIFVVLICKPRMRTLVKAHVVPPWRWFKPHDNVDYSRTTNKAQHLSRKTLSTSVFRTDTSFKHTKDLSEMREHKKTSNPHPGNLMFWKRGMYSLDKPVEPEENSVQTISLTLLNQSSNQSTTTFF